MTKVLKKNSIINKVFICLILSFLVISALCGTIGFIKISQQKRIELQQEIALEQKRQETHSKLGNMFEYVVSLDADFKKEENIYLIQNQTDLNNLSKYVNENGDTSNITFMQTADITINSTNFSPIGTIDGNAFKGNYDGQNYTVNFKNMNTSTGNRFVIAMFGNVSTSTSSDNLKIQNLNVVFGTKTSSGYTALSVSNTSTNFTETKVGLIGNLCGAEEGTWGSYNILNCQVAGSVSINTKSTRYHLSAFTAYNHINNVYYTNCVSKLNITDESTSGEKAVGGIIGYIEKGGNINLSTCTNLGQINISSSTTSWANAGGLVGCVSNGIKINQCSNTSSVSVSSAGEIFTGGIVGRINAKCIIDQCFNTASISSKSNSTNAVYVGGICGYLNNSDSSISNCFNSGTITSHSNDVTKSENITLSSKEHTTVTHLAYGDVNNVYKIWSCNDGNFTSFGPTNMSIDEDKVNFHKDYKNNRDKKETSKYSYFYRNDLCGGICGKDLGSTVNSLKITNCYNAGNIYSVNSDQTKASENYFNFEKLGVKFVYTELDMHIGYQFYIPDEYTAYHLGLLKADNVKYIGDARSGEISGNVINYNTCYSTTNNIRYYSLTADSSTDIFTASEKNITSKTSYQDLELKFIATANGVNFYFNLKIDIENNQYSNYTNKFSFNAGFSETGCTSMKDINISNIFNTNGISDIVDCYVEISDFKSNYKNSSYDFGDCWNQNNSINGGLPYLKWAYWDDNANLN